MYKILTKVFIFLIIMNSSEIIACELELKLAYFDEKPNSASMTFPNDSIPRFVKNEIFLTENDFFDAKIIDTEDENFGKVVQVKLTESAVKIYNFAAYSEDYPGIAVFLNGKPINLVQTIHPVDNQDMIFTGYDVETMNMLVNVINGT